MNRKIFFYTTQKVIPDGEGFNALPIAFVYPMHVIARVGSTRSNPHQREEIASSGYALLAMTKYER